MKRIAILGCENSHANTFLKFIAEKEEFSDVEVVGVYSNEPEAAKKLNEKFGVPVLESFDSAVGKIDGLIITARHGDNHYLYAKPYIASGIPMFIDKPITVSEADALEFMRELKANAVRVSGGSSLRHAREIEELRADAQSEAGGKTVGGFVRAPLASTSPYGGFFFYAQHLVEMVGEIFGRSPQSVSAFAAGDARTVIFRYADFDVTGLFCDGSNAYYAARFTPKTSRGETVDLSDGACFYDEFDEFYKLLCGGEQQTSYADFIAPVFVMNAISRSLESGREEAVNSFEIK